MFQRRACRGPECETESSSFIRSGARCGCEAGDIHRSILTRQNEQSRSSLCLLAADRLSALPCPFSFHGGVCDIGTATLGSGNDLLINPFSFPRPA